MQLAISKTRIFIVLLVTLASILWTYPTARYYMHLRNAPTAPARPAVNAPAPAKAQKEKYAAWEKVNPVYVKWAKDNAKYVAWEEKSELLRQNAIPLGLDLIGGVDVDAQARPRSGDPQSGDQLHGLAQDRDEQ